VTPSHRGRALAVIAGGSSAGTPPRHALGGYLAVRRSLGYKLDRPEKLLAQFIGYLEDAGAATVTTDHALAWATLPGGDANWHAYRLAVARGFAIYLHTIDPSAEVPPAGLIPSRPRRATPYLYSGTPAPAQQARLLAIVRKASPTVWKLIAHLGTAREWTVEGELGADAIVFKGAMRISVTFDSGRQAENIGVRPGQLGRTRLGRARPIT
jgi:hypothetical protein